MERQKLFFLSCYLTKATFFTQNGTQKLREDLYTEFDESRERMKKKLNQSDHPSWGNVLSLEGLFKMVLNHDVFDDKIREALKGVLPSTTSLVEEVDEMTLKENQRRYPGLSKYF